MKLAIFRTLLIICLGVAFASAAFAGPVFDDLLNAPIVDQKCPADKNKEGMFLINEGIAKALILSKEKPLGQTIKLGNDVQKLWKISVGICCWEDNWQKDEAVTFRVYDSPAKSKTLYERVVPYAEKWHRWDLQFDTQLPAKPGQEFYFEISHNGGGDNAIAVAAIYGDDYKAGQGYIAGQPQKDMDLYFQAIVKPKRDRIENLKKFLSQFDLDRPELIEAKKAYLNDKYDEACTKILRVFEDKYLKNADWLSRPEKNKASFDTLNADLVCDENRLYKDPKKKDQYIRMDSQTNWRETYADESDLVRQNDLFAELGLAYYHTGNEKYAKKLCGLMMDFMQDNTSFLEGGMCGKRWSAMGIGWRLGDAWDGWFHAMDSKGLIDDVRLGWINYQCRMAHFAMNYETGGNQANATADALMQFAARFPIYKDSKTWFKAGYEQLVSNSMWLFMADGACREPAMNYHGFSLATLLSGIENAKKFGMELPKDLMDKLEKALAYTAYMLKPDGQIPSYGDTGIEEFRPNIKKWDGWRTGEALKCAKMFNREDCLYIATAGKSGKRPEKTSYMFPNIRHYIMRSDWGGEGGKDFEQARYLFLRGGYMGSHGHWDQNQITLYAYGRPLIIDPGRTTYGTDLMFELTRARSHNVLLVDDYENQQKTDITLHSWHATPAMDFVDNSYAQLYPGISHRRAIVFVRPDYFVMFDRAESDKPHKMGINFWLTPPEVTIDNNAMSVNTNEPNGSNILIKLANKKDRSEKVDIVERKGTVDHEGIRNDMPVITFWQNNASKAYWTTILYPYPQGMKAPVLETASYSCSNNENSKICVVQTPSGVDVVFWAADPTIADTNTKAAYVNKRIIFNGRSGLIRTGIDGLVSSFAIFDGLEVTLGDEKLAKSSSQISELSVEYKPDRLIVTCSSEEPTLEIATLGKTIAVVNGKETTISGATFKPFKS